MNFNPCPKGCRTFPASAQDNIAEVPLRDLFWSAPATSVLLEEAEQRIATVLRRILMPEPVQLFDDLYEDLAC